MTEVSGTAAGPPLWLLPSKVGIREMELTRRFRIPLHVGPSPPSGLWLRFGSSGLELRGVDATGKELNLVVDFRHGAMGYRLRRRPERAQALARAVGGPVSNGWLLDATAGLGRDGSVLAALGWRVTLVERSSVLAALLDDGLSRAVEDACLGPLVADRLELVYDRSEEYMRRLAENRRPDVVYLDPMYPQRRKSALVKGDIRALQCVAETSNTAELLATALGCARGRVVVKRPKHAPSLSGPRPIGIVRSTNTRYDLYRGNAV